MSWLEDLITRNREALERDLSGSSRRKLLSPATLSLSRTLIPRLHRRAAGRVLDAGCGTMPYREELPLATEYSSLDVESRAPGVQFIADLEELGVLGSGRFDTVICLEVLEHVRRPTRVLEELGRVLRTEGTLILSIPYLARLHEEPNDYFRFTRHGLRFLLEEQGFSVMEIISTGSIFSFLGHQVSTIMVSAAWHIPVVKHLVFWSNAVLITVPLFWLDRLLGPREKLPLGYVVVARR